MLKKTLFYLFFIYFLSSFAQFDTRKVFKDKDYIYYFSINSLKRKYKPNSKKNYYWFGNGIIHVNKYGYSGQLLDGVYEKKTINNYVLIEKGKFSKGLKDGFWKKWDMEGNLTEIIKWSKGYKQGEYKLFNNGHLFIKGFYKHNKKQGHWKYYSKEGFLIRVISWRKDRKNGIYLEYKNGKVIKNGHYKNDNKEGKWLEKNEINYYKNGKIITRKKRNFLNKILNVFKKVI